MDEIVMSVASFMMGVSAFLVSRYLYGHFATAGLPKDMMQWHAEVEHACCEVIRARIYVAECEKRLMDLSGTVPADFNATLFAAPELAKITEDALVRRAEADGVFPERRFDDVKPLPDNVVTVDNHEWVAGQLLKKVGS